MSLFFASNQKGFADLKGVKNGNLIEKNIDFPEKDKKWEIRLTSMIDGIEFEQVLYYSKDEEDAAINDFEKIKAQINL